MKAKLHNEKLNRVKFLVLNLSEYANSKQNMLLDSYYSIFDMNLLFKSYILFTFIIIFTFKS